MAGGFAAISSGILPVRFAIFNFGLVDLLYFYGRSFGDAHALAIITFSLALIFLLVTLGAMARSRSAGHFGPESSSMPSTWWP